MPTSVRHGINDCLEQFGHDSRMVTASCSW